MFIRYNLGNHFPAQCAALALLLCEMSSARYAYGGVKITLATQTLLSIYFLVRCGEGKGKGRYRHLLVFEIGLKIDKRSLQTQLSS